MSGGARPAVLAGTEARPNTVERILDAAEQCLGRFGIGRFSLTDVAQQAGLSRGALYLHFADKDALIKAVLARLATRFVASSESVVRSRRTLGAQVAEAAVFIREHLGDQLLTLRLPAGDESLLATLMTAQIEGLVSEWVDFWEPFIAQAEARGEVRAGLDHRKAGEWIVRLMLSVALMPPVSFDPSDPDALRSFVREFAVAGFAP